MLSGSGGPAGNARLTAWTGLVLLVLFAAEMLTLLDVRALVVWHVVIGLVLVPPALLKTASTGWRIVRYYTGNRSYRQAGPPPMPLRILGPAVVLSTLAVLGTGVALILLGPDTSRTAWFTVVGQRVDTLAVHKATFAVWILVTGLHSLLRLVPAYRILRTNHDEANRVPGRVLRLGLLGLAALTAATTAVLLAHTIQPWQTSDLHRNDRAHHTRPAHG